MEKVKQSKEEGALGFEWIVGMSAEFESAMDRIFEDGDKSTAVPPEVASYWHLRFLLAIAQQLSVIAGVLKEGSK